MMADIRRIVAGAAEAVDAVDFEVVVEAGNTGDGDLGIVEQLLSARYRAAMLTISRSRSSKRQPSVMLMRLSKSSVAIGVSWPS